MIETSSVPPQKPSATFGNLQEIFGKCSQTFTKPSEQFWEIFQKWSEIFGESSKRLLLVCLYNKQHNTWTLGDMEFIFESVHIDIERVSAANEWDIECEHEKINSISPSVHVLFSIYLCSFVCNFAVKLAFVMSVLASVLAIVFLINQCMVSISFTLISPSTKIVPHLQRDLHV